MSRRAFAPLLAAMLTACGAELPTPSTASWLAVGPIHVGMPEDEVNRALSAAGIETRCEEKSGVTECRTVHGGLLVLHYEIAGGRVRTASRALASTVPPAPLDEMIAAWEARYGPQDPGAPAVQRVRAIRHWYREEKGVYRVHLCGEEGGLQACGETVMDVTPQAVAARVSSEAWGARDARIICRTWRDVIADRCEKPDDVYVRSPGPGEVMRIRALRGRRGVPPAGGTLLFQSDGVVRHRMWRVPDGTLYGITCRTFDREICWEIAARYEPRELFTALVEG